jgi:hypothetical protein
MMTDDSPKNSGSPSAKEIKNICPVKESSKNNIYINEEQYMTIYSTVKVE